LGKLLFTQCHVPLSPSSINLVPAQAGKVTVVWRRTGHASQTIVVLPPIYGLTALEREMSTPPTLQRE